MNKKAINRLIHKIEMTHHVPYPEKWECITSVNRSIGQLSRNHDMEIRYDFRGLISEITICDKYMRPDAEAFWFKYSEKRGTMVHGKETN